jgi:hypothetical protein
VVCEAKRIWSHYVVLDLRKASRAWHRGPGRWPGLSLPYQMMRLCRFAEQIALPRPNRHPPGSDPDPWSPTRGPCATWCDYATLPNRPARLRSPVHIYALSAPVEKFCNSLPVGATSRSVPSTPRVSALRTRPASRGWVRPPLYPAARRCRAWTPARSFARLPHRAAWKA